MKHVEQVANTTHLFAKKYVSPMPLPLQVFLEGGNKQTSPTVKKKLAMSNLETDIDPPGPEPDVIVVVGGTEFHEFSYQLRSWGCGYFDAAFRRTEMKQSGRFEFPDREPEEWKLIKALAAPFSKAKLDESNVWKAVSWFDELRYAARMGWMLVTTFSATKSFRKFSPKKVCGMEGDVVPYHVVVCDGLMSSWIV
ncbi:expressed unknown protein [Seminavis robusta]|uniref:Uncharacterized protein n=1 Tax=Seminavis robusta TaxID=568900 RepID=A0A9N8HRX8_9STRA|nr:expressed unknown protein [Seminavis robusta]|eukprot:Sro1324_g262800.1 n/a (195) ;mRNA; f:21228-21906